MVEFNTFNKTFMVQFYCIMLKHCESYNIIYDIIQNPVLHIIWFELFDKDPWFIAYITNRTQKLVQAKIQMVSSSNQLKIFVVDMNS